MPDPQVSRDLTAEETLDDTLDHLAGTAPEFGGALSNHGPMASEALVRLGRAEAVPAWAERYAARLEPGPTTGRRLDPDGQADALGHLGRYGDWVATFTAALEEDAWPAVVTTWLPRLFPGAMAGATHGLIRTAHAVRAQERAESPSRRRELAAALAYWAASYVRLPGEPAPGGPLPVDAAARRLPLLPAADRSGDLIAPQTLRVGRLADWPAAVDALQAPADLHAALSELTRVFAGWYLADADRQAIGFVHGVTAPAAVRLLLPYVAEAQRPAAFAYTWQACAALRVALGSATEPGRADAEADRPVEEIVERAVAGGDEHAIKLTEACLREDRLAPDPVYLAAAADAAARLGRW